ncbi:MAG TPA: glycoside hydrolase family 30 protein [Terracidiphilus sp.]|nr:glycoside hydrolase family 30 protein [Terracidiphilus sp.]
MPSASAPRAWITSSDRKYSRFSVPAWQESSPSAGASIEIDPTRQFQSVLGFGGAFTDSSCYLLGRMEPSARRHVLEELYGDNGLRLSLGRTCIGSSDYSLTTYTFDDTAAPDPELKHFGIGHDRSYILPVLREALELRPDLFLFATPWSPPAWMKAGDSLRGGNMRKEYFRPYAEYFVKFLQAYQAAGVTVSAVTVQNEVDTDQDGKMPAALWGQEYEAGFIKGFLGPALRNASFDTRIWLLDHNFDLWGRVLDMLSDPEVYKYVDGVAWHGYAGRPDAMTKVHNAFPEKSAYWTEGGSFVTDPDFETNWAKWSATYAQLFKNWSRSAVAWNLVLNEKGGPNLGPFTCGGVVTVNSKTQELTRSGLYWALAHYAKNVRRGARVIATTAPPDSVEHVAFENPDGGFAAVFANQGAERDVICSFEAKSTTFTMPQNSVVTLEWS